MQNNYKIQKEITASLCDSHSLLKPTGILEVIQDIACDHAVILGVDSPTLIVKDNAFWVISRVKVNIYGSLAQDEIVEVKTWPLPPEGFRCNRHTTISKDGRKMIAAAAEWILVDNQTHRLRRSETVSYPFEMEHYPELAIEEGFSRMRDDFTPDELFETRLVRSSFIDLAHHVNNCVYCTLMTDTFSVAELEAMKIKSFEVVYQREALEGERLSIFRRKTEDGWFFAIRKADGNTAVLGKFCL